MRYSVGELGHAVKAIKFSTILKWVGYATAILSFFFGVRQLVKLFSDRVESRRKVDALLITEGVELKGHDYASAWRSLEQASQLEPNSVKVHIAQENLAMAWLEDIHRRENEKFSDVAEKLEPVLTRGVASTKDPRRSADLLAHIGWSYFLRSREAEFGLDPAGAYSKAAAQDKNNPYAEAMWGHWILWNHGKLSDAMQHFSSALTSGRQNDFVRRLEIAALFNCPSDDCAEEVIRVANELRKEKGAVAPDTADRIFSLYYGKVFASTPASTHFLIAVPAPEHVATFRWLFDGIVFDESKSMLRTCYLARLQEAAGQRDEALANYHAVLARIPKHSSPLSDTAENGLKRLSSPH
jgi:tetratricopeptide (TPR) repeat protein